MTDRAYINEAIEAELRREPWERPGGVAEAAALGAASTMLVTTLNALLPVVGAAAGGALAAGAAYQMARGKIEPVVLDAVESAVEEVLAARRLTSDGDAAAAWGAWAPWEELVDGAEVPVPETLPPPAEAGFRPTRLASYVGQEGDWVHPLLDGSRLHAHEYADGALVLHRDRVDPALGPVRATGHWFAETPEGNALGAAIGMGALGALAWWVVS